MFRANMLPDIQARLDERLVFNFRVPSEVLAARLPGSRLAPQIVRGQAVASFCVLSMSNITLRGLPQSLGLSSINCAHRFAVHDLDGPAVYVDERNTDTTLGAFITRLGFPGVHSLVHAELGAHGAWPRQVEISWPDGSELFAATMTGPGPAHSTLFKDSTQFAEFIGQGTRSYCPAVDADMLNVVDLFKEDAAYEPLTVKSVRDAKLGAWDGIEFDSAYRTVGGTYTWRYRSKLPV